MIVLALLGLLLGVPVLWTIDVVLLVIGLVLWLLGLAGREVAGRRNYW